MGKPGLPRAQGLQGAGPTHSKTWGRLPVCGFVAIPLSLIQGWLGSVCKKILSSFASHLLCKIYDVGRLYSHNKYCVPCAAIKLFSL